MRIASLLLVLSASMGVAHAQTWPSKPLRFIVPFPPGGGADLVVRAMGPRITEKLGQPIVVENRVGASGNIGGDLIAKAVPDGHTLGVATTALFSINPLSSVKMPFDPVKDLVPVSMLASIPFFLVVTPSLPAGSVRELVALAKATPQRLSYGHAGNGTLLHLSGELLKAMTGIDMVAVPYKGTPAAVGDLISGRIAVVIGELPAVQALIKAGKMRALGVTTARRSSAMPDLPTIAEAGVPGYDTMGWFGVVGPAGIPGAIVSRWNAEIVAALAAPDIRERLSAAGAEPAPGTPEEFAAIIRAEIPKWSKVVRETGLKLD